MKKAKILAVGVAMLVGMSGAALAQQGSNGNPSNNAAKSGGPGTHVGAQRTGSESNNQKVMGNHSGYQHQ